MFSQFTFTGNNGDVLEFDIGETPPGVGRPIKELTFEYNQVNTRRPKMEKVGSWPGFLYVRECLVHTTFDILAADTSAFNMNKLAITHAILPDPTVPQTAETLGFLTITPDGLGEDVTAQATIDGDIAIPDAFPDYGVGCQITWVVPDGVFYGVTSGDYYYLK